MLCSRGRCVGRGHSRAVRRSRGTGRGRLSVGVGESWDSARARRSAAEGPRHHAHHHVDTIDVDRESGTVERSQDSDASAGRRPALPAPGAVARRRLTQGGVRGLPRRPPATPARIRERDLLYLVAEPQAHSPCGSARGSRARRGSASNPWGRRPTGRNRSKRLDPPHVPVAASGVSWSLEIRNHEQAFGSEAWDCANARDMLTVCTVGTAQATAPAAAMRRIA